MTRKKHSYVPFYMDDWAGGTMRMPRTMRGIYFDICFYIWDKAEPVPEAELAIMLADLDGEGERLVAMLIASGKLERDERGVYQPRALDVAREAYRVWSRKSAGGRGGKGDARELEDSSKSVSSQNQNQNQNQKKKIPTASSSVDDERDSIGIEKIASVWNAMAAESGLKAVRAVTPQREANAAVLLSAAKIEDVVGTIETIPESKFLRGGGDRGWKISFDWLLCPTNFALVAEGMYHTDAELKVWTQADVDEWNRRSEKIGSAARWRLKGTKIAPLAAA